MKKLTTLLFALGFLFGFAQEQELERVYSIGTSISFKSGINIIQLNDTLSLPFIDDFSSNKLAPLRKDTSGGGYTFVKQHQFIQKDSTFNFTTLKVSKDTAFFYQIKDAGNDTVAMAPLYEVIEFNYGSYPAVATDTFKVWVNYHLRDTNLSAKYDTVVFNSAGLVNDSATYAVYPVQSNLWTDNGVNINNNFGVDMPTIGVATMDALDAWGSVYSHGSSNVFESEYLTSKPINLSSTSVSDSVYLSFYAQPKGNGDEPEDNDSLVIQFKDSAGVWTNVWSSEREDPMSISVFKTFYIVVGDSKFHHAGFQFRFLNNASLSDKGKGYASNSDQWNIDYVILDKQRTKDDKYITDVAFSAPPSTLLNGFYNVPWKHYTNPASVTLQSSTAKVKNLSNTSGNTQFTTTIKEGNNAIYSSASSQNSSIASESEKDFTENYGGFVFTSSNSDAATFKITYKQTDDLGGVGSNDSSCYTQVFDNYYAYDDGSSESGYGINSYNGQVAYFFQMLIPSDTLRGVSVFFNGTLAEENTSVPVTFKVWQEESGFPSTELYSAKTIFPKNPDSLNRFLNYAFEDSVLVTGSFFIGWQQTSTTMVNMGYDKNTNSKTKTFFKLATGNWTGSSLDGSLMLRPLFGKIKNAVSTKEVKPLSIHAYPNPTNGNINISIDQENALLHVVNLQGAVVGSQQLQLGNNRLDLNLPAGIYFLNVRAHNKVSTIKLIVR